MKSYYHTLMLLPPNNTFHWPKQVPWSPELKEAATSNSIVFTGGKKIRNIAGPC